MTSNADKLMEKMKNKLEMIKQQNEKLKLFNYKMESFLAALDAYSIVEPRMSYKSLRPQGVVNSKNAQAQQMSVIHTNTMKQQEQTVMQKEVLFSTALAADNNSVYDIKNDLLNRALSDARLKKCNKTHIIKIINLLYTNSEGMQWDDIIKNSGVPKYKCVEILNCFVNTSPPIIMKNRGKGLICCLNLDVQ